VISLIAGSVILAASRFYRLVNEFVPNDHCCRPVSSGHGHQSSGQTVAKIKTANHATQPKARNLVNKRDNQTGSYCCTMAVRVAPARRPGG